MRGVTVGRVLCLLCVLGMAGVAEARQTWFVDATLGRDINSGKAARWDGRDGPKRTIQAAIDAAGSGDGVRVGPGLYRERLVIRKALTVRGPTFRQSKRRVRIPKGYAWDPTVQAIIDNPSPALASSNLVDIYQTDDVVFAGFVVQSRNALIPASVNDHLLRVHGPANNIVIRNNVIGPNTNVAFQSGRSGRMGLYLVASYGNRAVTNSRVEGNTIFGCLGNGNNVFVWGNAQNYNAQGRGSLAGTVIARNTIFGSHRSGIEIAGSADGLVIRENTIRGNRGYAWDSPGDLRYGNGIVVIRMSSDAKRADAQGPRGLVIEDNRIHNNQKNGIYFGPVNRGHRLRRNRIHNNGWDGVRVDLRERYHRGALAIHDRTADIRLRQNDIFDNRRFGASVRGKPQNGFVLDARRNYWGSANGPRHGWRGWLKEFGDRVSWWVSYRPWLSRPAVP